MGPLATRPARVRFVDYPKATSSLYEAKQLDRLFKQHAKATALEVGKGLRVAILVHVLAEKN